MALERKIYPSYEYDFFSDTLTWHMDTYLVEDGVILNKLERHSRAFVPGELQAIDSHCKEARFADKLAINPQRYLQSIDSLWSADVVAKRKDFERDIAGQVDL